MYVRNRQGLWNMTQRTINTPVHLLPSGQFRALAGSFSQSSCNGWILGSSLASGTVPPPGTGWFSNWTFPEGMTMVWEKTREARRMCAMLSEKNPFVYKRVRRTGAQINWKSNMDWRDGISLPIMNLPPGSRQCDLARGPWVRQWRNSLPSSM